jgi:hypothetical protein
VVIDQIEIAIAALMRTMSSFVSRSANVSRALRQLGPRIVESSPDLAACSRDRVVAQAGQRFTRCLKRLDDLAWHCVE